MSASACPTPRTLKFMANGRAVEVSDGCRVVFLATPSAEVSLDLAPKLRARGVSVIDLSGAFRLQGVAPPTPSGIRFKTPHTDLGRAPYGMPELFGPPAERGPRGQPRLLSTAAILALAPLLRAGLMSRGASSSTPPRRAASRPATGRGVLGSTEVGDFRASDFLSAGAAAGIAQACGVPSLTFTAHLLPVRRSRPRDLLCPGLAGARSSSSRPFRAAYERAPFVGVASRKTSPSPASSAPTCAASASPPATTWCWSSRPSTTSVKSRGKPCRT